MQQRQPRLGDILDDYCPRERRLTNHAVVAMIGEDIRLTRCTTCDTEHDYKHARVPRVRKKSELPLAPALAAPVPRRIVADPPPVAPAAVVASEPLTQPAADEVARVSALLGVTRAGVTNEPASHDNDDALVFADEGPPPREEGPVHRQLIRAQLPRAEGQPPPQQRQAPDFTIRQPGGRPNRFRDRQQRGGFGGGFHNGASGNGNGNGNGHGNRGQGHGQARGNGPRPGGRPPVGGRAAQRHNDSRKRSK